MPTASVPRVRAPRTRKLVLALLGVFVSGCGGGEPEGAAEGEAAASDSLTFAPALGVDLASMTHSPTGLYSRVLEEGQGEPATNGTTLLIEYTGSFPNGTQFDASPPGQPFEVVLGVTSLIPGFTEGLQGIRRGESRLLVIPPEIGYGERGVPPTVPGNSTLVFRIRRVDGVAPAADTTPPPPPR